MKQYRITTAEFITPGESGDPDAILSSEDLLMLKQQAGITGLLQSAIDKAHCQPLPTKIIRERKYDE